MAGDEHHDIFVCSDQYFDSSNSNSKKFGNTPGNNTKVSPHARPGIQVGTPCAAPQSLVLGISHPKGPTGRVRAYAISKWCHPLGAAQSYEWCRPLDAARSYG